MAPGRTNVSAGPALIAFELAVSAKSRRWNIRNLFLIDPPEICYLHKNKNLEKIIYGILKKLTSAKNSNVDFKHYLNQVLSLLPNFNYSEEMKIADDSGLYAILINLLSMTRYCAKSSFFAAQLLIAEGKKSIEYVDAIEKSWSKHLDTPLI
ncbi:MAG: hypothetical protein LRY67_01240, partial [Gammaproteobacteria bacterium]|nr:hypothetical protein [Gammaproteobacteria bacterium]